MKKILFAIFLGASAINASAQDSLDIDRDEKVRGFKKDKLFSGGSVTLSFSNNGNVFGASPVLGYSLTKWLDAGIVINYSIATQRNYPFYSNDDKLKQTIIGPGAFVRIYPVKFIFLQGQFEHNFTQLKVIPDDDNIPNLKFKTESNSFLTGVGLANGREGSGSLFYYLSIAIDVIKDEDSPYIEISQSGKKTMLPIFRAGLQIPLFQGKRNR